MIFSVLKFEVFKARRKFVRITIVIFFLFVSYIVFIRCKITIRNRVHEYILRNGLVNKNRYKKKTQNHICNCVPDDVVESVIYLLVIFL